MEYCDPSGYSKRKAREPRTNVVSCEIDEITGNRKYVLRYKEKYLNNGNRSDKTFEMTYDKDLQALFKEHPEHLYNNGGAGSKVELPNGFSGDRKKDFREADKINKRENLVSKRPEGYTWEHDRDKKTLYLVKTDVHDSSPHTGGHSLKKEELSEKKRKNSKC